MLGTIKWNIWKVKLMSFKQRRNIRDWYRSINAFRAVSNPEITQKRMRRVTCLQMSTIF
jgi:hypothetical protein